MKTMTPIRVLLVEDNPGDVDLTRETLEEGKVQVNLSIAYDGVDAIEQLQTAVAAGADALPDLVLLDLNLPRRSGRDVLAHMRSEPLLRRVPVVVLTSSDAERDIVSSYELGANCYVTKPVGLEQFETIVRSIEDFWFVVARLP